MRLTAEQFDKLGDITADLGVVAVASVVLPALLDRFHLMVAIFGFISAAGLLLLSIWLVKRKG